MSDNASNTTSPRSATEEMNNSVKKSSAIKGFIIGGICYGLIVGTILFLFIYGIYNIVRINNEINVMSKDTIIKEFTQNIENLKNMTEKEYVLMKQNTPKDAVSDDSYNIWKKKYPEEDKRYIELHASEIKKLTDVLNKIPKMTDKEFKDVKYEFYGNRSSKYGAMLGVGSVGIFFTIMAIITYIHDEYDSKILQKQLEYNRQQYKLQYQDGVDQ